MSDYLTRFSLCEPRLSYDYWYDPTCGPDSISIHDRELRPWRCPACKHEWRASAVRMRETRGRCHECAAKSGSPLEKRWFIEEFPKYEAEYAVADNLHLPYGEGHAPTYETLPASKYSNDKIIITWRCMRLAEHRWSATLAQRAADAQCSICAMLKAASFVQFQLCGEMCSVMHGAVPEDRRAAMIAAACGVEIPRANRRPLQPDMIFLGVLTTPPDACLCIEWDGAKYHANNDDNDIAKSSEVLEAVPPGSVVVRGREDPLPVVTEHCVSIKPLHGTLVAVRHAACDILNHLLSKSLLRHEVAERARAYIDARPSPKKQLDWGSAAKKVRAVFEKK